MTVGKIDEVSVSFVENVSLGPSLISKFSCGISVSYRAGESGDGGGSVVFGGTEVEGISEGGVIG